MKKSILAGILSIIALLVISSCGDNGTNPTSNNEIMPLKVGNYWKYDIYLYDTLGNVTDHYVETRKVVSDTIINNERVYIVSSENSDVVIGTGLYLNRADGIYSYSKLNFILYLKYPALKGDKFNSLGYVRTVESTNNNYVTTIGNFSCYHYTLPVVGGILNVFFKTGIGKVAEESFNSTLSGRSYLQVKYVLKEYKVN